MPSHVLAADVGQLFDERLDVAGDRPLVVNPGADCLARLVEILDDHPDPPSVSVLVDHDLLKSVMEDFLIASRAADIVADGRLEFRVVDRPPNQSLLVTEDRVTALVTMADSVGTLGTGDSSFVGAASDFYRDQYAAAEVFDLLTPPLSRVRETLAEEFGAETAADFDAVLASLDVARGEGEGLDEVTISLLVAARNRELLYEISKWGEDVELASKATFSRTKTTLEDAGLIDTEKVPIQVGRPRLRLVLGDDRLAAGDPAAMAARAQQMLAE